MSSPRPLRTIRHVSRTRAAVTVVLVVALVVLTALALLPSSPLRDTQQARADRHPGGQTGGPGGDHRKHRGHRSTFPTAGPSASASAGASATPTPTPTPSPTASASPSPTTDPTPTPTPSPSATPTQTAPTGTKATGCVADPSSCGYPDAGTTGPTTALAALRSVPGNLTSGPGWRYANGTITVDGNNAVIDGITTTASIDISASNVIIRNSRIQVSGESWGIGLLAGSNITVKNNQIFSPSATGSGRMLVGIKDIYGKVSNVVIDGNEIWHASTGIQVDSGIVQNNYVHDMGYKAGDHLNGFTSNGGTDPLVIRHNTIFNDYDQTDAISLFQDFGTQANRVIDGNFVSGGGYTIYAGANPGKESGATNITVTNNRFASQYFARSGSYGPATAWTAGGGNVWTGNVWDSTGAAVGQP